MVRRAPGIRDGSLPGGPSRPVGRPRSNGQRPLAQSPRDDIVAVAARLFAERGFAKTTMSEIARAAGLQQSSLYYWFRKKEQILEATFALNRLALTYAGELSAGGGSPGLALYRLVRFHTFQLCVGPCDISELGRLARQQPDVFAEFWGDHRRLIDRIVHLLREGVAQEQFDVDDPILTAAGLLALAEGLQQWYRQSDESAVEPPTTGLEYAAEAVAEFAAVSALRCVLSRLDELEAIRAEASRGDEALNLPVA